MGTKVSRSESGDLASGVLQQEEIHNYVHMRGINISAIASKERYLPFFLFSTFMPFLRGARSIIMPHETARVLLGVNVLAPVTCYARDFCITVPTSMTVACSG